MNNILFPTKPWHTPHSTGVLPIERPIFMAVVIATSEVASPRTTSSIFITFAGEKKCIPITASGRVVADAISLMSRAEVFEARIAPGLQIASNSAKIDFLSSIFSNTASMTRSQSAKLPMSVEPEIRPIRVSTSSLVIPPRAAVLS